MTDNYENVNHLVLNFYPDGYSIAVKLNEFPVFTSETILETAKIPYEETGLLDYIANEELPPLLVEMIDNSPKLSQYKIWRNGCLVIEVRDKIESILEDKISNNNDNHKQFHKRSQYVVLKPTNLSMLYDVLNLTSSKCWSTQQRLQLESQIVLHNSPSLFLEPEPSRSPPDTHQRNLPHNKARLKSIYLDREINVSHMKKNGNSTTAATTISNHNPKVNNIYHDPRTDPIETLPPELTLQQFLASKRSTKRKSLPTGLLPRFHRHLREHK